MKANSLMCNSIFLKTIRSFFFLVIFNLLIHGFANAQDYQYRYVLDKSQVPMVLNVKEITCLVHVGSHTSVQVYGNGFLVTHEYYNAAQDTIMFTTAANDIVIVLTGVSSPSSIGGMSFTKLKNDKKWAFSIGFDDNRDFLNTAIPAMQSYGWKGTLFLTHAGFYLNDAVYKNTASTYGGTYYIRETDVKTLVQDGWGIANHTWTHNNVGTRSFSDVILNDIKRLEDTILPDIRAVMPSYNMINFAAPNFDDTYKTIVYDEIRDNGLGNMNYLLCETGWPSVMQVGSVGTGKTYPGYNGTNVGVEHFNFDERIGRQFNLSAAISEVDILHHNADKDHVYWMNVGTHQVSTTGDFYTLINKVYNLYGAAGTDEVWVEPSENIYSYLYVRENTTIDFKGYDTYGTPFLSLDNDTNFCNTDSLIITASTVLSGCGYQWYNANGPLSGEVFDTLKVTTSGSYYVQLTGACSALSSQTITTLVDNPITASGLNITGSSSPCEASSQTYQINSIPNANHYVWDIPIDWSGKSSTNTIQTTIGELSGTLSVTGGNSCGSSPVFSSTINTIPKPNVPLIIVEKNNFESGDSADIYVDLAPSGYSYQWYSAIDGLLVGENEDTLVVKDNGEFYAAYTGQCSSDFSESVELYKTLAQDSSYQLLYTIDRSNVLDILNNKEITLMVDIGANNEASVFVDGVFTPHSYSLNHDSVIFNTSGTHVSVYLRSVTNPLAIGGVEKAVLKYNKKWAFSIGFDDNYGFIQSAVPHLRSKGWKGTLFLTHAGNYLKESIFRAPPGTNDDYVKDYDVQELVKDGWSIGNHSWSHRGVDATEPVEDILFEIQNLEDTILPIIREVMPNYNMISFANPNYDEDYSPVIRNNIRDKQSNTNMNYLWAETGGKDIMIVDEIASGNVYSSHVYKGTTLYLGMSKFNYDLNIGRRFKLEEVSAYAEAISTFTKTTGKHYWFNAGLHKSSIEYYTAIDTLYERYGPRGYNELWVAPSEDIYSYIITRENIVIEKVGSIPPKGEPLIVNLDSDTFCVGSSVTLSADSVKSGCSNEWYNSSGIIVSASDTFIVTNDEEYYYFKYSGVGCPEFPSNYIHLKVDQPLTAAPAAISSSSNFCLTRDADLKLRR